MVYIGSRTIRGALPSQVETPGVPSPKVKPLIALSYIDTGLLGCTGFQRCQSDTASAWSSVPKPALVRLGLCLYLLIYRNDPLPRHNALP